MSRRIRNQKETESLDVFPAFTDLMSNAFMILSLFLLLALIESQRLNYNLAKIKLVSLLIFFSFFKLKMVEIKL
jgi:uncharacterized membrane protein